MSKISKLSRVRTFFFAPQNGHWGELNVTSVAGSSLGQSGVDAKEERKNTVQTNVWGLRWF